MKFIFLVSVLGTAALIAAEKVKYDSCQVHRLVPKTISQLDAIRQFQLSHEVNLCFFKNDIKKD